jgi:hypothetical protein
MKHNIIKIENYLLIVDGSEIKQGDWCLSKLYEVVRFGKKFAPPLYKKIRAHLPLNNSPILEGVDLLPPYSRHQENGVEE